MLLFPLLLMASKRRITVTLDEETWQFFADWAEADDRTVPYLIARIAADYVREQQTQPEEQQQKNGSRNRQKPPASSR